MRYAPLKTLIMNHFWRIKAFDINISCPAMFFGCVKQYEDIPGLGARPNYTMRQILSAFNSLGREGKIRKVKRAERAYLDQWEFIKK